MAVKTPLRTTALTGLLVVLALASAGCGRQAQTRGRNAAGAAAPAPVPTVAARIVTVRPTVTIAGIIAPLQNVAISSSLTEPALTVTVNEGDHVRRGQTLALLDTTDLRANLEAQLRLAASDEAKTVQTQYQAKLSFGQGPDQVTQARATLAQAQQTLNQGRVDLQRDQQLLSQGYVSQQQFDQQNTAVVNDEAAARSAQAALSSAITNQQVNGTPQQGLQAATIASAAAEAASARATADQIRSQIAKATIVSPVDGVVVNRNLNPGEYPGGRTLFTLQALSHVYAELNASSADVFRIRTGAQVALQAGGDQTGRAYHGRIVAVLGQVQPGATNFTVKAEVENPQETLQAGIPVTGIIDLPAATGVGIPTAAFLDDTRTSVMLAQKGTAALAKVREIASDGTTSIVQGIAPGQTVISDGQLGIVNGQALTPGAVGGGAGGRRRGGAGGSVSER